MKTSERNIVDLKNNYVLKGQGYPCGRCIYVFMWHYLLVVENKDGVRACLHGGGGPQVGEVTCLAVVENWPAVSWGRILSCKQLNVG